MSRTAWHGVLAISMLAVALISVTGIVVATSGRAAPPSRTATVKSAAAVSATNPEADIGRRLALKPGGACTAWMSAYVIPVDATKIDTAVLAAGGPGHWLSTDVWIGDAQSAAEAFRATWAELTTKGDSLWIETSRTGRETALLLESQTTHKGAQVWRVGGSANVAPCSSDGE